MEKNKSIKVLRTVGTLAFVLAFVVYGLLTIYSKISSVLAIDFQYSIFYWLVLALVIFAAFTYRLSSSLILGWALIAFLFGSLFSLLSLGEVAEVILRLSMVFWLVGIPAALIEYKKDEKNRH